MIEYIGLVYIAGLLILFPLGMSRYNIGDITSFHVTVWLCWPILIIFGLIAVPFLILDMIRTLYYKFRIWRIQVETNRDDDNY